VITLTRSARPGNAAPPPPRGPLEARLTPSTRITRIRFAVLDAQFRIRVHITVRHATPSSAQIARCPPDRHRAEPRSFLLEWT
jgi:hypothetical protein